MACTSPCPWSNQLEPNEQALYPVKHITWCVYALFIDDEEHIKRDCKYSVTKVSGNRAIVWEDTPTTDSIFGKWLRGL